jgi:hypothetical protein
MDSAQALVPDQFENPRSVFFVQGTAGQKHLPDFLLNRQVA